jgi:hypothetical protein
MCVVTLTAYRKYRASRPAVFECTEADIEVLTVKFGRCDRLRRDDGNVIFASVGKGTIVN